jgi:hypothetical protein
VTEPQYRVVFKVNGRNEFGADTGSLSLYQGTSLVIASTGFSGGRSSPAASDPIPTQTYHIMLSIRNTVTNYPTLGDTEDAMHQWYGIEKIDEHGWQKEWGHLRAHLNEPHQNMAQGYRGNFLHGKLRPDDYTHGCICERSETILNKLWTLPRKLVIPVQVTR